MLVIRYLNFISFKILILNYLFILIQKFINTNHVKHGQIVYETITIAFTLKFCHIKHNIIEGYNTKMILE